MLGKRYRLKSRYLFRKTLDSQRICVNNLFAIYGLKRLPQRSKEATASALPILPQFGFIVSKKVHKRAVRRNRVKRLLREAVRMTLIRQLPEQIAPFAAIVIIARQAMLEASFSEVCEKLCQCFTKTTLAQSR